MSNSQVDSERGRVGVCGNRNNVNEDLSNCHLFPANVRFVALPLPKSTTIHILLSSVRYLYYYDILIKKNINFMC